MKLSEIVLYLDELLDVKNVEDSSLNGLQVENTGCIEEICTGVDACCDLADKSGGKSLIIAHHGLLWKEPPSRITRDIYKIVSSLIKKDSALYGAHLPLDIHKEFGNNHGFYKLLGWDKYIKEPYGLTPKKLYMSALIEFPEEREFDEVLEEIYKVLGRDLLIWNFGRKKIKRLAFASGYVPIVSEPVNKNLDLYISGERAHYCYSQAKDNKLNMIFGGHYNTETIGVKLLGDHLAGRFNLKHTFIDIPTGL